MGRVKTIARRSFLIGSAAVAGGVVFGTYLYKREGANPLLDGLKPGETAITPYVKIDAQGITLITPRADVGQGAWSMQAHMIAEELDIDPRSAKLSPGPADAIYYNGVVGAEALPIAATSDTMLARGGRGAVDVMGKLMGLHITGGSSTVPDMYDRLRMAGAVARETLIKAAMKQTGLPRDQLGTENGCIVLPDGLKIEYIDLASIAAEIEPVQDVTLRDPSEWRYLTKPQKRTDIVAKSTGRQIYGIDMQMDGMVIATTRTNPAIGGGLNGFDAEAARQMRGVSAVLPITGGIAVVADNTWRAFQAAQAVECDWGPSPYIGDSADQFAAVAASFTNDHHDSRFKDEGDVEEALQDASVVEVEYRIPYLAHAPMEPMSVVVKLTEGRLDIWTGTQIPRFVKANMARLTGLDGDDIHVHVLMSGGSFGRRLEDDYIAQAVEIAMQMPDTPIKMIWQREEDFTHDFPRPLAIARGRGAVADAGIATFDLSIAAPSVAESSLARLNQPAFGPDVAIVAGPGTSRSRSPTTASPATARQRWCPSALGGRSGRRATGSCTKASWTRCATPRVQTRCKSGCACAGTTHRARCWRPWARCRNGAAIWGRTGGGGWPLRWPLACPWPRWSRSPTPPTASVSTRCSSPPMWAACWTP